MNATPAISPDRIGPAIDDMAVDLRDRSNQLVIRGSAEKDVLRTFDQCAIDLVLNRIIEEFLDMTFFLVTSVRVTSKELLN